MKKIIIIFILLITICVNASENKLSNVSVKKSNNNSLSLSWDENDNIIGYKILRSTTKKGKYKQINDTSETNYLDLNLTYGKTYYYKVIAYNDTEKATSKVIYKKVIPNKIMNLKISNLDEKSIKISWDKESLTGYEIYRSTNNKKWSKIKTISKNSTVTYNNTKLKSNKTYYYKVRGYVKTNGKKVYGSFSNIINVKTLTKEKKNAINDVKKYSTIFNCSKEELISKINNSKGNIEFAINYLNIDFKKNALINIGIYNELFNLSKEEMINQLKVYDRYNDEEIEYAIDAYEKAFGENKSDIEYKIKKDLYQLGYSKDEFNDIYSLFSKEEITKYLLEKKYNNLLKFKSSPYFVISNIERYQNYFNRNNYSEENAVLYVEIGLDYAFYTNMKKTNENDGKLILVNKYYYHSKNYNANLVTLGNGYGRGSLNKEAAENFRKMVDAAKKDGIKLWSVSAYRSYSTQKVIYNRYVNNDGVKKADTYSARPGHSEHSTGFAVDINTASSSRHFENTKEYKWLKDNSYKYGFVERYMLGKEFITGYKYEPWHFRYFGVDVATKLYEMNVTYEEYLIMSK